MKFEKYMHIEKFKNEEVEGIEFGKCYIFPKLDGTNASVWYDDKVCAGSRKRQLSVGKDTDNAGFCDYILNCKHGVCDFIEYYKHLRLTGEWLCLSGDTVIKKASNGRRKVDMTLKEMYDYANTPVKEKNYYKIQKENKTCYYIRPPWWKRNGYPSLYSLYKDEDKIKPNRMEKIIYSGKKEVFRITTRKGFKIKASRKHPFFTPFGFKILKDLNINDCVAISQLRNIKSIRSYGTGTNRILMELKKTVERVGKCQKCGNSTCLEAHHIDQNHYNHKTTNILVVCCDCHKTLHDNDKKFKGAIFDYEFDKIVSIENAGIEDCYDIKMSGTENEANFIANGFIVHNCPHTFKDYQDNAWRKFYVFDVYSELHGRYLEYEEYKQLLDGWNIDYIPPLCIIENPTDMNLYNELKNNYYLVKDGCGCGEGIVIKNYDFKNKFGRITWAKLITNEFKTSHSRKETTVKKTKNSVEQDICDKFVTNHLVEKVYAKIVNEMEGWNSDYIQRLMATVYYDLINEEMWMILLKFRNPVINFKRLNALVIQKIKEIKSDLF